MQRLSCGSIVTPCASAAASRSSSVERLARLERRPCRGGGPCRSARRGRRRRAWRACRRRTWPCRRSWSRRRSRCRARSSYQVWPSASNWLEPCRKAVMTSSAYSSPPGSGSSLPARVVAAVLGHQAHRARAPRPHRVAVRVADRQRRSVKTLPCLTCLDAAQHLAGVEEVERPDLVVVAPAAPVARGVRQQVVKRRGLRRVGHGPAPLLGGFWHEPPPKKAYHDVGW